jgi:PAS domain S-box-containing protein
MDGLQATKGISVFIPMLFVMVGIAFYIGFQFIIIGRYRRRDPVFLVFGLMSLVVAIFIINQIAVYQATSAADMAAALRHRVSIACLFFPLFFAFVGFYTSWRAWRLWLIPVSALYAVFLLLNLLSPNSLRLSELREIKQLALPWGELLNIYGGSSGKWNSFYLGVGVAILLWGIWRAVVSVRAGERKRGWHLGVYCGLQIAAIVHDTLFVDKFGLRSFYLAEFPYFLLVLLMSLQLGSELQAHSFIAESTVRKLHEEIAARARVEEENRKLIHDLGERVKELTALHHMARILQHEVKSVPELLQEIVSLLPPAWQYPEVTAGRIRFAEMEFKTANFVPTEWSQVAEFGADGLSGTIEVVYLEARPANDIGPFLLEEKNLINSLAEMLGSALSRRFVQEALQLSEERFAKAFQASPEPISIYRHSDGILLEVNERWTAVYGYSREEALGRTSLALHFIKAEVRQELLRLLEEHGSIRDFEIEFRSKQGEIRYISLSAEQLVINNETCDIYLHRDITEQKQAQERINLLQMITMDIAAVKDLPSALEVVLQRVCEKTGWALGQAWVPKKDGATLDCCPAWFATTASLEEFRASSRDSTFSSGIGLPGRVWALRQPIWVRDVRLDRNFPRAEAARRGGLKAGLGVPILSGDEVIAVLEFFLHEPRDEDELLVKVIAAVAMQIGLVIERKRAEEELRRTSERLQLATRAASIGIWDWDVVNDQLVWDEAMYRLYGVQKKDFTGAYDAWAKSLAPEDLEWANEEVQAALRGEREFAPEFRIVWPDGSVHFTQAASQTFHDEEGCPIRMVGVNYDVTERKLAEEALRESQRRFSDTLANLQMLAVMADTDGNITFCNDYLLRLTGWERHEVIGRNWFDMFLPEQEKERVSTLLDEVPQEGLVTPHFENEIKTRSGEQRLVKWTNTTLRDLNGQFIGVAALGDDITQRKLAEEQLLASREQLRALSERLRRVKEEEGIRIAREIHDELGSALTSLKWSLLRFDKVYSATDHSPAQATGRKEIEEMVGLVDATINTVRRIASELRPGVLDDLGLVSAIEWHAQQFQELTGIVCRFESSIENVDLNREQATTIFRIFQEAMTNILRHAQATKVNVLIEEEEGEFVLEIKDNGRGITESEKSGTRSLGLLGMRERAHSVGGRIEINGIAGKGSLLLVRLPIHADTTF